MSDSHHTPTPAASARRATDDLRATAEREAVERGFVAGWQNALTRAFDMGLIEKPMPTIGVISFGKNDPKTVIAIAGVGPHEAARKYLAAEFDAGERVEVVLRAAGSELQGYIVVLTPEDAARIVRLAEQRGAER